MSLRAASAFMIAHTNRWIELIADECGGDGGWTAPKDFSNLAHVLAFDVTGDLCFGKSLGIKEPGHNPFKTMPHNIAQYLKFWYPITRSPLRDFVLWLRPKGFDALMEVVTLPEIKNYYQFVKDSISRRITLEEELNGKPESQQRLDMFHFLSEAKDPDTGHPAHDENELWAEANMLTVAGADTTAISLSGIFFYLMRYHVCFQKLVREIRSTFTSIGDTIPGPELQSCTYLKVCIEEGMRLTPTGPSEMNREVRQGGITINGERYPEEVIVGAASWTQSRNEVYRDPYVFSPERWIVDEANGVTAENTALCPLVLHGTTMVRGLWPKHEAKGYTPYE